MILVGFTRFFFRILLEFIGYMVGCVFFGGVVILLGYYFEIEIERGILCGRGWE